MAFDMNDHIYTIIKLKQLLILTHLIGPFLITNPKMRKVKFTSLHSSSSPKYLSEIIFPKQIDQPWSDPSNVNFKKNLISF